MHKWIAVVLVCLPWIAHADSSARVAMTPPIGWRYQAMPRGQSGAVITHPTEPRVRIVLQSHAGDGSTPASLVAKVKSRYPEAKTVDGKIVGSEAKGVTLELTRGGARIAVRQWFFHVGRRRYVLAMIAPVGRFAAHEATFARFRGQLRLSGKARAGGGGLAARCGSQLKSAASWKEALARAKSTRRPILVALWLMPGWTGANAIESGPFSDPDVVSLVRTRFVLLRMSKAQALASPLARPAVYGMYGNSSNHGLLVVDPRTPKVVRQCPREIDVVVDMQLRAALAALPELDGAPVPPAKGKARWHFERGELDRALALAKDPRLRAACFRRQRKGAEALRELERTEAPLDEALVRLRMGQLKRAVALLAPLDSAQALFWLGAIQLRTADRKTAEATWTRATEQKDDPWAWRCAAAMASKTANTGPPLHWPTERMLDLVRHRVREATTAAKARKAATAYLLKTQLPDGSWLATTTLGCFEPDQPEAFSEAGTALAALALLDEGPAARAAVRKALAYFEGYDARREKARPRAFTGFVFRIWAYGYRLRLLARSLEAKLLTRKAASERARVLVTALKKWQQSDGGWCYAYGAAIKGGSMSFTTAAHLRSLQIARDAGLPTDAQMIDKATRCLRALRTAQGHFGYRTTRGAPRAGLPECAGRGPLCQLALGGDLTPSLTAFGRNTAPMKEVAGQALTHSGRAGLGSHYLLMNAEGAAAAIAALPRAQRARHREHVLDLLTSMRRVDGSYIANANFGPHIGTALALRALQHLD